MEHRLRSAAFGTIITRVHFLKPEWAVPPGTKTQVNLRSSAPSWPKCRYSTSSHGRACPGSPLLEAATASKNNTRSKAHTALIFMCYLSSDASENAMRVGNSWRSQHPTVYTDYAKTTGTGEVLKMTSVTATSRGVHGEPL